MDPNQQFQPPPPPDIKGEPERRRPTNLMFAGIALVLLVGDEPYYARLGFRRVPRGQITLPGPVDPERLLIVELVPGALAKYSGLVARG